MEYPELPGNDPQQPQSGWRNDDANAPRSPYGETPRAGHAASQWPTYATSSGRTRPAYSSRDYPDHGYWDKQQPAQPVSSDHTDSWRSGALAPTRSAPAASAVTPSPHGSTFDDDRDYPSVFIWTGIWYLAPVAIYALWAAAMSADNMRGTALHAILGDAFNGVVALLVSLGVAGAIRRTTLAWRAITVGFGAAVIGAGLATLILTSI